MNVPIMRTDYRTVKVELKDGIAVLSLNNPPVNQLSEPFVKDIAEALSGAFSADEVKAVC